MGVYLSYLLRVMWLKFSRRKFGSFPDGRMEPVFVVSLNDEFFFEINDGFYRVE